MPTSHARPGEPAVERSRADQHARLASLLVDAKAGDRGGLDAIVRELTPLLWHVARSEGLDEETAADVVQGTWLNLLGSLANIHTPIALTGWLITVTKREAWRVNGARRTERVDEDVLARLPDPADRPDEWVVADEQRKQLWRAVAQLSDRCQRLMRVVAFTHRPSYQEVSVALGIARGSIGPTRGRCLARLRALLAVAGPSGDGRDVTGVDVTGAEGSWR
ncbi:MAG TPA: sigma-70 family RNA polymerase sigma factor [Pseudonocardiaceae bacterium]|jgi:RNA polymerase sigma factor (sigma-70 family)|nr:sigma-70 family RNA polymerase sigma factor [Pseudonocardiaceae bacterium]